MARAFFCPLSSTRRSLLEQTPGLIKDLRDAIAKKEVPGAIDFGSLDPKRLALLEECFALIGPRAFAELKSILDGTVGARLKRDARIVDAAQVAIVAKAMTRAPNRHGKKGSLDELARRIRDLFVDAWGREEAYS